MPKGRKFKEIPLQINDGGAIDAPNPVDSHVGGRIRLRRTLLGMSQEKLGESLGLTFQQVQKYERGANRVGASRLYELSKILDVPVSFFFDDLPEAARMPSSGRAAFLADHDQAPLEADPLTRRETLELVRAYYRVTNPAIRRKLFELAKALGEPDPA